MAFFAASTTYLGDGKSGSPAPNPITGLPCDLSSLALLEIAIVPEGLINLSNFEISII